MALVGAVPNSEHRGAADCPPDPRAADSGTPDSRATDSRAPDARAADSRAPDSRITDSRVADSRVADSRVTDSRVTDSPVTGSQADRARAGVGRGLTDDEFTRAVEAVTSAFGDPTRRRIYLSVRDHPEGVTASTVAEEFALHANVARHHLDKLVAGGYVEVFVTRSAQHGAGRPSKRYRPSARVPVVDIPRRQDDLLILLLGQALSLVPPEAAEAMAERVGEDYGRSMAGQLGVDPGDAGEGSASFRTALHAIADALSAHGFAAHAEARAGSLALIQDQCPFFDTARQHPVICAVDRGMVRGMLAGLYGQALPTAASSSRARGDDACITVTAV